MTKDELLRIVDPTWHSEFLNFIETGEASEEFLTYMDQNPSCQRAVEAAFSEQAAAFESFSRDLRATVPAKTLVEAQATAVSHNMAHALEQTLQLPPAERASVLRRAVSALTQEVPKRQREELKEIVSDLERRVAAVV